MSELLDGVLLSLHCNCNEVGTTKISGEMAIVGRINTILSVVLLVLPHRSVATNVTFALVVPVFPLLPKQPSVSSNSTSKVTVASLSQLSITKKLIRESTSTSLQATKVSISDTKLTIGAVKSLNWTIVEHLSFCMPLLHAA